MKLRLRFGLSGTNNNADGQDFDYNSYSLAPGVEVSLPHDVILELSLTHTRTHYANDNSLASTGGVLGSTFAFKRDDTLRMYAIGVKRLIIPGLDVFLQFQRVVNESNIRAYDYDQSSFNFGLAARL